MKIRGKLLTLILIPLLAVFLAAVWGFRDQSVQTEQAETALDLARANEALHDAMLAIGDERLALYTDPTSAEATTLRESTDATLAAAVEANMPAQRRAIVEEATATVASARSAGDVATATQAYTDAIVSLLTSGGGAADVYSTEQIFTAIAGHTAFEMIEAREEAWFRYLELAAASAEGAAVEGAEGEGAAVIPVADVVEAASAIQESVALAEQTAMLAAGQTEPTLRDAANGAAENRMENLSILAAAGLADGEFTVDPQEIVLGLSAGRVEWSRALVAVDEFLVDSTTADLDGANGIRSLFAFLGVVGMVILAGLVFVIYRSITGPLESLLIRARSVAHEELPNLVYTLRSDENFDDLPEPSLIPVSNDDEIGELVQAFNEVQLTAHELATEQALGRKNVGEMFVNLGRRNQQLLQRILGLLTDLERDEEDPDTLRDLFVLDNIVTRMRRNAESLLVLAGAQTPRQWSNPVSLEDTVRSALSEVEGYERIDIAALAEVRIPGSMVADVAHLLAELIENAVAFSDPSTQVLIGGHFENDGYLVTIFDQGIGMSEDELDVNNRRIIDPPPLDQAPTKFLGLFVVGRLADRHDIQVRLAKAPGRGIMARVMIPSDRLVIDEDIDTTPSDDGFADVAMASATERAELANDVFPPLGDDLPTRGASSDDDEFESIVGGFDAVEADEPEVHTVEADAGSFGSETVEVSVDAAAPVTATPVEAITPGPDTAIAPQPVASAADALPTRGVAPATGDLPTRSRGQALEETAPPAPANRRSDDGLPTRVRGQALGDEGPAPTPERPAPAEDRRADDPDETAGSFSSMMTAFSSGVNRGLADTTFDAIDEGNDQ